MHYNGWGVKQDYAKALELINKSVEQGNAAALTNLGLMYIDGEGVLRDMVSAHMWINISSVNGQEVARTSFDKLEGILTQEQIADATRRAKVCMASNYQDCD